MDARGGSWTTGRRRVGRTLNSRPGVEEGRWTGVEGGPPPCRVVVEEDPRPVSSPDVKGVTLEPSHVSRTVSVLRPLPRPRTNTTKDFPRNDLSNPNKKKTILVSVREVSTYTGS